MGEHPGAHTTRLAVRLAVLGLVLWPDIDAPAAVGVDAGEPVGYQPFVQRVYDRLIAHPRERTMKFAATLPASGIERAKAWYAAVLQLEPAEITDSGDVWCEIGGTRLMLYPSQFAGTNQATAVNIRVDDVEASVAELGDRGAVFESYDFGEAFRTVDGIATSAAGERMAWQKDSQGNLVSTGSH